MSGKNAHRHIGKIPEAVRKADGGYADWRK